MGSKFASTYKRRDLLYYCFYPTIEEAIAREKQLNKWKRGWKDDLGKSFNPALKDLFEDISEMQ